MQRGILCFAAVFRHAFQIVEAEGKPFIFLEGQMPAHWNPDAHLYRVTVRRTGVSFALEKKCERLRLMPFRTDAPERYFIFRRDPKYTLLLRALNALYDHDQPDRFTIPSPIFDGTA